MANRTGYSYGYISDVVRGKKLPGRFFAQVIKQYTNNEVQFFEKPKRMQIWLWVDSGVAEKIKSNGNGKFIEKIVMGIQ